VGRRAAHHHRERTGHPEGPGSQARGTTEEAVVDEVLVGVDGSEGSRAALRWAVGVAGDLGSRLRVVSAWQYPADAVMSFGRLELPRPEDADERVEGQLRDLLAELDLAEEATVVIDALRGPAAPALLGAAAGDDVRMLVVGSRGLGGFQGLRLGSVSRQLTEHATRPVTVVRHDAPGELRTLLVGADGSDDATRAMRFAGELATDLGAELVVVNATGWRDVQQSPEGEPLIDLDTRRAWVEEWCAPLREDGVAYRIEVVRGDPRTALLEAARDADADLVVVGSRGRGPLATMVLGSVAASLLEHSEVPVTVLPH
jgi:nucleotide-binding universal stress UspA family protein